MTLISYENVPIHETAEPLVDLSLFPFVLEPVYFQTGLSSNPKMYCRKTVANKLLRIQGKLEGRLCKIWDAWRPRSVQINIYMKFWNELSKKYPDWNEERLKKEVSVFVTDPTRSKKIPPHSTGGALDLTLVDSAGKELEMGTGFDHFGPEAAALFYDQRSDSKMIAENRRLLREAMLSEDFRFDNDEWWHFDFGNQLWALSKGKPSAPYGEKHSVE